MSATNRGAQRRFRDSYPTPAYAIDALIPQVVWGADPQILEPCVGSGHISSLLILRGITDAVQWCEISKGRDFLEWDFGMQRFDFIVTNPPFSLAKEFIDKSLTLANCVIMLLPMSFLGSAKRKDWWKQHPPTAVFVLSKRPSFTGDGKTDSEVYGWFVFDTTGRQKRGIHWL